MSLDPLFEATAVVQAHTAVAILALAVGSAIVLTRKGTARHRAAGRAWVVLMTIVAATSFAITGLNPGHFSWIHLLSIITLIALPLAVWRRRRGDIRGHATAMIAILIGL